MSTEFLQQILTSDILEPARASLFGFLGILPQNDQLLCIFLNAFIPLLLMLVFISGDKFFDGTLSSYLKLFVSFSVITLIVFIITRTVIIQTLDLEISNMRCSVKTVTSPTAEHSLDYIKAGNPVMAEGVPGGYAEYGTNNTLGSQTEFIKSDEEQNVCVCICDITKPKSLLQDAIYKVYAVAQADGNIKGDRRLLDLLANRMFIKSITYSENPEAIQQTYTKVYTPKIPISVNSKLDDISIQTKEGQEVRISDPQVIISNTCKVEVTYGEPEYFTEYTYVSPSSIHVGPYIFNPINYKVYVLPDRKDVNVNIDVNVDVK